MDAFTQIIIDAISEIEFDRRSLRTAGGDELDDKKRIEIVGAFLRCLFFEGMLAFPMPDFAARTIIEAWSNRVDWDWVAQTFLTEAELN